MVQAACEAAGLLCPANLPGYAAYKVRTMLYRIYMI
jgi:hypothetical protein